MKKSLLLGVAVLGTILTGCAVGNGYAAVRFGPPPAPRYGVVGYAPGPGFVWTEGYWDWRGGRWFWMDGRWLRPPHRRAVWVPGSWREDHHRWQFQRNTGPNPSPDRGALRTGRGCRGCGQRVTGCQPLPQNVRRKQMAADKRR